MFSIRLVIVAILGLSPIIAIAQSKPAASSPATKPLIEPYLERGDLAGAEAAITRAMQGQPTDALRFELGTVQFLRAIEHLCQSLGTMGFRTDFGPLAGFARFHMPSPPASSQPAVATYEGLRRVMQNWIDDLSKAEKTLAGIGKSPLDMPLHIGRIRLDLNGDGRGDDDESLRSVFQQLTGMSLGTLSESTTLQIDFDRADVHWMRGYCHFMMALTEGCLAYDFHELFERTGHLFFNHVKSPYNFFREEPAGHFLYSFPDIIAFIHLLNFHLVEPARMPRALEHFESMLANSRAMWDECLVETDNNHEWIPNPKQSSAIANIRVSKEMIDSWLAFVSEAEAILKGRVLVPFWRGTTPRGINLRRVFTEPRDFDLVLWIQGTAAATYIEKGAMTRKEVWERLIRVFSGDFLGYAAWFN